jgi:hypothetical protein
MINVNCNAFSFIDDECTIEASYSPCETEYFHCVTKSIGDYDQEEADCTEDFTDAMFWSVMREEQWWQDHSEYEDFFQFWEEYHFGDDYDYDNHSGENCRWIDVESSCSDFNFMEGECQIRSSYNPCVTDHFICEINRLDDYGNVMTENCDEDFTDVQFWSVMREELWWQEHPEHADFYNFWELYHFGDNTGACEDKTFMGYCTDFNMLEERQCVLNVAYNTCDDTGFTCSQYFDGAEDPNVPTDCS